MVPQAYSIADARNHLTQLVREIERGKTVGLTRRGRLVAVVVSEPEFRRLNPSGGEFRRALKSFLKARGKAGIFTARQAASLRERSPGRPVAP